MDNMDLWKKALNLRKQLGEAANSPIDIFALAFSIEQLSIVYYPMGDRISGIYVKNPGSNVIAVNSAMTIGRQRFSLAHELYHLFFDDQKLTTICAKNIGVGSEKEIDADQFASYFLMPPDALSDMVGQIKKTPADKLSIKDIVRIEQHFQISRQAVLSRLIAEKELTIKDSEPMRKNIILSAIVQGYDDTLYRPTPKEKQYGTYGYYIQQANRVAEQGLVSNGKFEELLLSAYRPDLVYGDDAEKGEVLD